MIILAADHGGFDLKEKIKTHLEGLGKQVLDVGNHKLEKSDDYPDFAIKAAEKVLENPDINRGILCCRSGTGEVIIANRYPGIRATISWTPEHAKKSREHNNTNVIALPADYISTEEAIKITDTWLKTEFSDEKRHNRRLRKIRNIPKERETISQMV